MNTKEVIERIRERMDDIYCNNSEYAFCDGCETAAYADGFNTALSEVFDILDEIENENN